MSSGDGNRELLALLKAVSRSFYLSVRFLPAKMRGAVSLGYLLARASDTVADVSRAEPDSRIDLLERILAVVNGGEDNGLALELAELGRMIDHKGERELLTRWAGILAQFALLGDEMKAAVRRVIGSIIDGQVRDVSTFEAGERDGGIISLADRGTLECYTYSVAGCVGRFWTEVAVLGCGDSATGRSLAEQTRLGEKFGQGLQMVNILRDLPKDRSMGRCYLPGDWQNHWHLSIVAAPDQLWMSAEEWRELCAEWIAAGREYAEGMRGVRLRFTAVLPALLAEATLELLNKASWDALANGVKVTRGEVRGLALKSLWFALFGRRA